MKIRLTNTRKVADQISGSRNWEIGGGRGWVGRVDLVGAAQDSGLSVAQIERVIKSKNQDLCKELDLLYVGLKPLAGHSYSSTADGIFYMRNV